jgi:hypothetical protein
MGPKRRVDKLWVFLHVVTCLGDVFLALVAVFLWIHWPNFLTILLGVFVVVELTSKRTRENWANWPTRPNY